MKLLDVKDQMTLMTKLKFIRNRAMLKVTNSTQDKVIFDPADILGIVDLRSLGYYTVKQGVLQQNWSQLYHIASANAVFDQFNKLINTLKKEERNRE